MIIEKTEDYSKKQLVNVFSGHPPRVWLEKDGMEIQADFTSVQAGDIVIVNAGEIIPVDGHIQEGLATIDQHILTGESQPVEKASGDKVFAAAIVDKAASKNLELPDLDEASYEVGYGIKVMIDGQRIMVGSARFMSREVIEHLINLTLSRKSRVKN